MLKVSYAAELVDKAYPIIKTHPSGSFLIFGLNNLFTRGISGADSSFAHFSRFCDTKTMSFMHHAISVRYVSKPPFPRSFWHASLIASELSLMAQYSFLN